VCLILLFLSLFVGRVQLMMLIARTLLWRTRRALYLFGCFYHNIIRSKYTQEIIAPYRYKTIPYRYKTIPYRYKIIPYRYKTIISGETAPRRPPEPPKLCRHISTSLSFCGSPEFRTIYCHNVLLSMSCGKRELSVLHVSDTYIVVFPLSASN
jgi:hypothetical protein